MDLFDIALASKLSGGGGGGSANTANIAFRNRYSENAIDVIGAFNVIAGASTGCIRLQPNEPYTQSVFMSQSGAEIYIDPTQIPQNYAVEVSGSIAGVGDGYYIVTGDGGIEIKTGK